VGEGAEVDSPVTGQRGRRAVFAFDVIDHQLVKLVLAVDVAVQRRRADPERRGDLAHRNSLQALVVGQLHGGGGDLGAAAGRSGALGRSLRTSPDDRVLV
jgi:hypothetical protein